MVRITTSALDGLLYIRDGRSDARWNFPAAVGTPLANPGGLGSAVQLTYSFLSADPDYYDSPLFVQAFNEQERAAAAQALAAYSRVARIRVQLVAGVGQLTFAKSVQPEGGGFAFAPAYSYTYTNNRLLTTREMGKSGDIWINQSLNTKASDLRPGGNAYATLLHEIGHAIGFKHPFESSANGFLLAIPLDTEQHTVMSYFPAANKMIVEVKGEKGNYRSRIYQMRPTTLMPLDIEALQYLYGKNNATNRANTLYHWKRNTEILETIYDAGGIDTIDASNQVLSCHIDLRAGSFSSIALRQTDAEKRAALNLPTWYTEKLPKSTYDGHQNLAIANGVTIENATGGRANDVIRGNRAANTLRGGGGNDRLFGKAGRDVLEGGAGNDLLDGGLDADVLTGGSGRDTFLFNSPQTADRITDFRSGTEKLRFSQATIRIGNGNRVIDNPSLHDRSGGFAASSELVIFQTAIAGEITPAAAVVGIGSATTVYQQGDVRLFAVHNGMEAAIYRFTAAAADAFVSASELTLLASLTDTTALVARDFQFSA